jgi:hypothetical protein
MGPPTCGTGGVPGVTIGHVCISVILAAGGIFNSPFIYHYLSEQIQLYQKHINLTRASSKRNYLVTVKAGIPSPQAGGASDGGDAGISSLSARGFSCCFGSSQQLSGLLVTTYHALLLLGGGQKLAE